MATKSILRDSTNIKENLKGRKMISEIVIIFLLIYF